MIFLADLQAESNAQGDVDLIAIRCFRMKHELANVDPLNGHSVEVMNSSFALIFRNMKVFADVGSLCFFCLKILDLSQDSAVVGSYEISKYRYFMRCVATSNGACYSLVFGTRVCLDSTLNQ